ncbi:flagellar assembly peptidoglycan hydrolase FlgJ [Reinekea thalattae]|nr:flagellar assembly peptidoglycan hydrolase FlgJ [Reinekea thalattae]
MTAQFDAAFNYNDLSGLNSIKQGARKDDPEALKAVAQQFESMFMGMVLKSMREANDVLRSDLLNSSETDFYRQMHDEQLSLTLSQQGGFGLADVIYKQLTDTGRVKLSDIDLEPFEQNLMQRKSVESEGQSESDFIESLGIQLNSSLFDGSQNDITESPKQASDVSKSAGDEVSNMVTPLSQYLNFDGPKDFIKKMLPLAEKAADAIGVSAKVLVAQAALETGWGDKQIKTESGDSSFNFFGIKANHNWQGESASTLTTEYIDGHAIKINEPFRAYSDPQQSFDDYAQFITQHDRYNSAVENADDDASYVTELQNAGYATDPQYAEKIITIAQSDWFDEF